MRYPTDDELNAIYQVGNAQNHAIGLRMVYQAAIDAANSITDPNPVAAVELAAAPTTDVNNITNYVEPTT